MVNLDWAYPVALVEIVVYRIFLEILLHQKIAFIREIAKLTELRRELKWVRCLILLKWVYS